MFYYNRYTAHDFLNDDDFIKWQLLPDTELDMFWERIIEDNPAILPALHEAISLFHQNVRTIDCTESDLFIQNSLCSVQTRIDNTVRKHRKIKLYTVISSIAGLALILLISVRYFNGPELKDTGKITVENNTPGDSLIEEVTLITGDSTVVFAENTDISYHNKGAERQKETREELTYNQLIVPRGRHSTLVLEDGTKIWINSGSKLKFPVSFTQNERRIYIDGEIYLDVAHNTSKPFYIETPYTIVKVTGTEFNINAYKEDGTATVVLVNGIVEVNTPQNKIVTLKPSQMYLLSNETYDIKTVDVDSYISWKNGWLQLNSMTFRELMARLSRYYNREMECSAEAGELRCSGKLILFDDLDIVLNTINLNLNLTYTKKPDKIFFNRN